MKTQNQFKLILAFLYVVSFPFHSFSQGIEITSGGGISITGAATIVVENGNLVNNGTYTKGSEVFTMSGNSEKTISGSSSTSMHNLSITNSGGVITKLGQLTANALSISSGSKFTIDTVKAVTVTTNITNSAGVDGILIKSSSNRANGSLIFHNAAESPVPATVEMYCKASRATNYKWQFFGIPVQTLSASPTFDGGYVRKYNEAGIGTGYTSDKHWIQLVAGNTLTPFTGYEATQTAAKTFYFQGDLVNSTYNSGQLAYTTGNPLIYTGQHLIGNPYTAAIDIKQLVFGNRTEASVYLYNTGSLAEWTSNSGISTPGNSPGQYTVATYNTAGVDGIPGQIPSMQAFLIKAMKDTVTATISIPYSSVVVKNADLQRAPTMNKSASPEKIYTKIEVQGSRYGDRLWIFSDPTCTRNFDNGWDGYKFLGSLSVPQIFSIESDGYYQINGVDNIDNSIIGFQKGEDSNYKLVFSHENDESNYSKLYLIDLQEGTTTDITQSGTEYPFISTSSDPVNRFKIVTSLGVTTGNNKSIDNNKLTISNLNQTFTVKNSTNLSGNLFIYDMSGRLVQKYELTSNGEIKFETNLPVGLYNVQATTKNEIEKITVLLR
jgi:hypothetical protein